MTCVSDNPTPDPGLRVVRERIASPVVPFVSCCAHRSTQESSTDKKKASLSSEMVTKHRMLAAVRFMRSYCRLIFTFHDRTRAGGSNESAVICGMWLATNIVEQKDIHMTIWIIINPAEPRFLFVKPGCLSAGLSISNLT